MARIVLETDVPDGQLEDALAHVKRGLPKDANVVHECTYDRFYTGSIVENCRPLILKRCAKLSTGYR